MNKVLTFIIGLLCGSIITVLGFMIYIKSIDSNMIHNGNGGMYRPNGEIGEAPQRPDGEMPMNSNDVLQNRYKR